MARATSATSIRLERDAFGRLVLIDRSSGARQVGVLPVRAFPLSSASHEGMWSLLDTHGHEVVWIERVDEIDTASRVLLEEEFASLQLLPKIQRLASVSGFATPSTWTVETDRGPTRFVLKSEDDIRRLPDGRLLIAGGDGVGYLVPDRAALDRASRRLLERFL